MLESEESLEENIFMHISRRQLEDYRRQLVKKNISLLEDYLGPMIAPDSEENYQDLKIPQRRDRSSL